MHPRRIRITKNALTILSLGWVLAIALNLGARLVYLDNRNGSPLLIMFHNGIAEVRLIDPAYLPFLSNLPAEGWTYRSSDVDASTLQMLSLPRIGQDILGKVVIIPGWLLLVVILAPTLIFWRLDRRRPSPGHCPRCRYNLTANTTGVCPECGLAIQHKAT